MSTALKKKNKTEIKGYYLSIQLGNDFIDITPKTEARKEKNDKSDFIRIKTFVYLKGTFKKGKDNLQSWRKYMQIPYLMRLLSRIYKVLLKCNKTKKIHKQHNSKIGKGLE